MQKLKSGVPFLKRSASQESNLLLQNIRDLPGAGVRRPVGRVKEIPAELCELNQLTVQQVADICQVHPKTVRQWIKDKDLVATRKGKMIRISVRALRDFLEKFQK